MGQNLITALGACQSPPTAVGGKAGMVRRKAVKASPLRGGA